MMGWRRDSRGAAVGFGALLALPLVAGGALSLFALARLPVDLPTGPSAIF